MISRFFKRKEKPAPKKKAASAPSKPKAAKKTSKILTAEGWRRMMMRKSK